MQLLKQLYARFFETETDTAIRERQLENARRELAMAEYWRDLYQVQVEGQARLVHRLRNQLKGTPPSGFPPVAYYNEEPLKFGGTA